MTTQQMKGHQVLKKVVLVTIDQHGWSARRKMTPADLGLSTTDLPPETLASLGGWKMIDPTDLQVFDTLRREAEGACGQHGQRLNSKIYAVPLDRYDEVQSKLDDVMVRFYQAVDALVAEYQDKVDAWVKLPANVKWATAIRKMLPSADAVKRKFSFDWLPIMVDADPSNPIAQKTIKKAEGLAGEMIADVAAIAEGINDRLSSLVRITSASFNELRRAQEKLVSLAFVDRRAQPVADMIGTVLDALPASGTIPKAMLIPVFGLLHVLGNADRIRMYGDQLLEGKEASAIIDAASPSPEPQQQPAPAVLATAEVVAEFSDGQATAVVFKPEQSFVPTAQRIPLQETQEFFLC